MLVLTKWFVRIVLVLGVLTIVFGRYLRNIYSQLAIGFDDAPLLGQHYLQRSALHQARVAAFCRPCWHESFNNEPTWGVLGRHRVVGACGRLARC
jgi:hypothetical protein